VVACFAAQLLQVGNIRLAGRPTSDFSRGEWARAVAMVSQEPVLFSGSIADNIAYGKFGRCSMEEITAAAEAANAHEFITELPEGYNTLVGDRGTLLSGGWKLFCSGFVFVQKYV
jgi:ATP-binding cassette subfamily B (MDR/TAP) protein 8